MAKRPSLASANVKTQSAAATAAALRELAEPPKQAEPEAPAPRPAGFYAATREGLKKVTVALKPEERIALKILAARKELTSEDLLREAVSDLFLKYEVEVNKI